MVSNFDGLSIVKITDVSLATGLSKAVHAEHSSASANKLKSLNITQMFLWYQPFCTLLLYTSLNFNICVAESKVLNF